MSQSFQRKLTASFGDQEERFENVAAVSSHSVGHAFQVASGLAPLAPPEIVDEGDHRPGAALLALSDIPARLGDQPIEVGGKQSFRRLSLRTVLLRSFRVWDRLLTGGEGLRARRIRLRRRRRASSRKQECRQDCIAHPPRLSIAPPAGRGEPDSSFTYWDSLG